MAKILALWFLLSGHWRALPDHFLPFVSIFDHAGPPELFRRALQVAWFAGAAALLFNYRVRAACLVLGGVLITGILSSRVFFENNRTFTACLWLLAGLHPAGKKPVMLRYQVILLYFGAGLNKLLDADWRSGQFFQNMASLGHQAAYAKLSSLLPHLWLSKLMGWTVISVELAMAAGLAARRWLGAVVWMGLAFHTVLLLVVRTTFGMFYCATAASYLLFLDWPLAPIGVSYSPRTWAERFCRILKRLNFDGLFEFKEAPAPEVGGKAVALRLWTGGRVYSGSAALYMALIYNPVTYFAFAMILPLPLGFALQAVGAIVFLAFVSLALIASNWRGRKSWQATEPSSGLVEPA